MASFNSDLFSLFSEPRCSRLLTLGTWGLEREALRITPDGNLALTPHPAAFGDKQTNPRITTDFSESQLEMITPPKQSIQEAYRELEQIHREVRDGLGHETLWPLSMPGRLPEERLIPIARYGAGQEAEVYRKGLALRYGKKMQMISGIHYNYSFSPELLRFLYERRQDNGAGEAAAQEYSDFVDGLYFSVARNFLRFRWLLLYLFGASPAFDETYEHHALRGKQGDASVAGIRNATSLRMSKLGYYNSLQNSFSVSYNSKREYIRDLRRILRTRSEQYAQLGLQRNGEAVQLNDRILQKASEFYSPIRFKQVNPSGGDQLDALEKRGVDYLEMRVLDLDPFSPNGIDRKTLYFAHTLMVYSLLAESPELGKQELEEANGNHYRVALSGRKEGLLLERDGRQCALSGWAGEILHDLQEVAALLDGTGEENVYTESVRAQLQKLDDPALLPSATIEREMQRAGHDMTSYGLMRAGQLYGGMQEAREHKEVESGIEIPELERLAFLANRFVNTRPAVANLPAQCC